MKSSELRDLLSQHLDFRCFEDDTLEMRLRGWRIVHNPTCHETVVQRWLGTDDAYRKHTAAELRSLLEARPFSSATLDYLLRHEKRTTVLAALLHTQPLNHDQLWEVLTRLKSAEYYTDALSESMYLGLAAHPHIRDIVERATPRGRLYALAFRVTPATLDDTAAWLTEWSREPHVYEDVHAWTQLVHRRPDLNSLLVDVVPPGASLNFLLPLARSPWLCRMEDQWTLADLDIDITRRRNVLQWVTQNSEALTALVQNPRVARVVVDAVQGRLAMLGDYVTAIHNAVATRLATWSLHGTYEGDFVSENDPARAAWLAEWFENAGFLSWGAVPGLPLHQAFVTYPVLRAALSSVAERNLCTRATVTGRIAMHGRGTALARFEKDLSAEEGKVRHEHFERTYVERVWSSIESFYSDTELFVWWLQQQLGRDVRRYETMLALCDNWTGTLGELVTTAALLN